MVILLRASRLWRDESSSALRDYGLRYDYRRFWIAVAEEAGILEMW